MLKSMPKNEPITGVVLDLVWYSVIHGTPLGSRTSIFKLSRLSFGFRLQARLPDGIADASR